MPISLSVILCVVSLIVSVFYIVDKYQRRITRDEYQIRHFLVFLLPISIAVWMIVAYVNYEQFPIHEHTLNIQNFQNADGTFTQLIVEGNSVVNFNAKYGKYLPAGKKLKKITWNSWSNGIMFHIYDTYEIY